MKEMPINVNVDDPIFPAAIYEKPPFPVRMSEHSFVTGVVNKSERMAGEHEDQIKVDPQVALVKDLVTNNVGDSIINFCVVSTNLVTTRDENGRNFSRTDPFRFPHFTRPFSYFWTNPETDGKRVGRCRNPDGSRNDVFPFVFSESCIWSK